MQTKTPPNPTEPTPGTSKDTQATTQATAKATTQATTDPTLDPAQEQEDVPDLTDYVKSYKQAAKVWFDTVQVSKEQA